MTEITTEIVPTNTSNFVATMAKEMKRSEDEVKAMIQLSFPTLKTGGQLTAAFANAKRYDLDPFAKEIYAYLDGKGQLVMITANSGFLKIARKQPGFISINSFAVYESDVFDMENGTVTKHRFNSETLVKRKGQNPIGAYAVLKMDGQEPIYNWVDWSDYVPANAGYGPWSKQKSAMIRKCATSVLCREQFGLSGLYDETEMTEDLERSSNAISALELSNDSRFKRSDIVAETETTMKQVIEVKMPEVEEEQVVEATQPPPPKKTTSKAKATTPIPTSIDSFDAQEEGKKESDVTPKDIPKTEPVASTYDSLPVGIDQLNRIAELCKQLGYSEATIDTAVLKLNNRDDAHKAIKTLLEKVAEKASEKHEKTESPKASSVKTMNDRVESEYADIKADPRFKQMCGEESEPETISANDASAVFGEEESLEEVEVEVEVKVDSSYDFDPVANKAETLEYLGDLDQEDLKILLTRHKQAFKLALNNFKKNSSDENAKNKTIQSAWCACINQVMISKGYGIV